MAYTLSQLRTRARQRADMENNNFISDSELTQYINDAIEELYDLIAKINPSYLQADTDYTFTTTSGTSEYALPSDFYKLLSVNAKVYGDQYRNIPRYNHGQRNHNALSSSYFRYKLKKTNKIEFVPTPEAGTNIKLEYVDNPPQLANNGDEWVLEQFSEFIVVRAAIDMLDKEESDSTHLKVKLYGPAMNGNGGLYQRVKEFVHIDDAEPDSITDVLDNYIFDEWFGC